MAFFKKNQLDTNMVGNTQPSWISQLEEMRKKRDHVVGAKTKTFTKYIGCNDTNIDPKVKNKVYQYYLKKWEQEHHQLLNNQAYETQILLANKWTVQSDNVLLKSDSVVEEENSIILFAESGELEERVDNQTSQDSNAQENDNLPHAMIQVTVIRPNFDPNKNLCIVNEQELVESIKAQLKPQLQDMLQGMVKTMLLNNYEIMLSCVQKEIQSEIPKVIDDLLEHNIKSLIKKSVDS